MTLIHHKTTEETVPIHDFEPEEQRERIFEMFPLLPKKGPLTPSEPHRHNYFELFFFENGGGSHIIDFEEIPVEACSAHLVAAGQVHHLKRSNDSVGHAILFRENFLGNETDNRVFISKFAYMETECYHPTFEFSKEEFTGLLNLLNMAQEEANKGDKLNVHALRHYVNILILECRKKKLKRIQQTITPEQLRYAEFRKQVSMNYKKLKKVREYAELLRTDERNLNKVSKKFGGKSASAVIADQITLEAKRLIVNTTLPVKEICYALHFEDQAHFSKFFKSQCGYSPSQFRELYK